MIYTVGFMFSLDRTRVALIKKNRPDWQNGKFNGIGGHVESGEKVIDAMRREFLEETGVDNGDWVEYATYFGPDYSVSFFKTFSDDIFNVETITDEVVILLAPKRVEKINCIGNLRWLIPLALDDCIDDMFIIVTEK